MSNNDLPMVVAVVGAARTGSSCTAGIIHNLGISMGESMKRANRNNPKGFFEDRTIRPIIFGRRSTETRVVQFRAWARRRQNGSTVIGVKHGRLCRHVTALAEAFPNLKIIVPERPISEITQSIQRAGMFPRKSRKWSVARMSNMVAIRDKAIADLGLNVLRLPFTNTLADPESTVRKIIDYLGITPTPEQVRAAVQFVSPELRHFGGQT